MTFTAAPEAASDDGGSDGTTGDEGGGAQDAAPGVDAGSDRSQTLSCPAYSGVDPYCKALSDYCGRCQAQLSACEIQNIANCELTSQVLSVSARAAAKDCADKASCGDDAGGRCVLQKLSKVTPSAAQQKLAQDYCNVCPGLDTSDQCAADFYFKADGGAPGTGDVLIELNDGLIAAIDKACITFIRADAGDGGVAACAVKFAACAAVVVGKVAPGDACKNGGK